MLFFFLLAPFSQHTGLCLFDRCRDRRGRAAGGIKLVYVLLGASSFTHDPLSPAHTLTLPRVDRRDPHVILFVPHSALTSPYI